MLNHKMLRQYSAHFASMVDSRTEFVDHEPPTATSTTDNENAKLRIAEMPEFTKVSHSFSTTVINRFLRNESNGKAAGCSGVSAELVKPVASNSRSQSLI